MELYSFITWLLYSSVMASFLVALIILIRIVFKNKLQANWQYLLWFLLLFKLLIPYAPESSFSVFNIVHQLNMQRLTENYFAIEAQEKTAFNGRGNSLTVPIEKDTADNAISVNRSFFDAKEGVLCGVWFLGVISLTTYTIYLTYKLNNRKKNSLYVKDRAAITLLKTCKRTLNIKKNIVLVESSTVRSPMVVGAVSPYIILPMGSIDQLSKVELRFILLHELAHFKRKDLYINWITAFLQIMHWFNPVIWYAFYQMRQDRELACDAYVLSAIKATEYKSYGAAIISFLESKSYVGYDYTIAKLVSGKAHMKRRITMIASYKKCTVVNIVWGIMIFLLLGCLGLTDAKSTSGAPLEENSQNLQQNIVYEDLSTYFPGYDGTFVLLDMEKDQYQIYNDDNSKKRVSPNSTYKIISSLAGLETGVLTDENTEFVWDKTTYPIEQWNRNHTLASAIAYSVNWYFQKVDARVGKTKIENYLKQIEYGNCDVSGDTHDFWIESSLKISPLEQVEMLRKLYTDEMPFSQKNIDIVKKVIKVSSQDEVNLYGKTGTGIVNGNSINGWFVGYVERSGKVYIFATNIQGKKRADGTNAKNITISILKDKNIL